jgi:hypothetical protein
LYQKQKNVDTWFKLAYSFCQKTKECWEFKKKKKKNMNLKIIIFEYITIQENFLTIPTLKTQLEQSYKYLNESCKYS